MNQQTTLKQWLLSAPVFFAITSFLLAVLISLTAGLLLPNNETTFSIIGTLMFITTVASAIITIRKIPTRKMDRAGIVTIFNIRMLVLALASISSLFVTLYITPIQMWLFKTMQSPAGMVLGFLFAICITLISLYILGITIIGLWACFLRARTMNIPLWKIILRLQTSLLKEFQSLKNFSKKMLNVQ